MKKNITSCCLILAFSLILFFYWGSQKRGMFIDENYTYLLSNSQYGDVKIDSTGKVILANPIISREMFLNLLEVQEDNRFDAKSVYLNQTKDVHPPLYYWLINFCSSLFPNSHSKWIGLGLNCLIYSLLIIMLFLLSLTMFESRKYAIIGTCLYSLCTVGLSTALFIRMYVLSALFTTSLAYLFMRLLKGNQRWYIYLLIVFVFWLGLMTHYYFILYASFVCLSFIIYEIANKEYKLAYTIIICALLGTVLMVVSYPAVISHLFNNQLVSGGNAVSNICNIKSWPGKIARYCYHIVIPLLVIVLFALTLFFFLIKNKQKVKLTKQSHDALIVIIPAYATFLIVCIISPVIANRYVWNIVPIALLIIPLFVQTLSPLLSEKLSEKTISNILIIVLAINGCYTFIAHPDNLFESDFQKGRTLSRYKHCNCIFFDDNYIAPLVEDILQLLYFDEIFLTGNSPKEGIWKHINSSAEENLVVFIDIDNFWSSGFNAPEVLNEIISNTNYYRPKFLFSNGLSETYVLCRK